MREDIIFDVNKKMLNTDLRDVQLDYILYTEKNGYKETRAIMHSIHDHDKVYEFNSDEENCVIHNVPDYDFDIDEYMFHDLEDGYEFIYGPLEAHCGMWNFIAEYQDEINYKEGLNNYLKYCKDHHIDVNTLSLVAGNIHDVSHLYEEINNGYKIISSYESGKNAVVLAKKEDAPSKYVTWLTTSNRERGYDLGHYFNDYKEAFEDFRERSHTLLEENLISKRIKTKKKNELSRH